MPRLTFLVSDGTRYEVEVSSGTTVKDAALENLVPGIVGECGGCAACGTCHVYVDPGWASRLPPIGDDEESTLSGVLAPLRATSRLGCQIVLDDTLDGLALHLPPG